MGYALCRRPLTIARCSKIVDSWQFCKQISDFWCPNLSFGMLGASNLAFWGTLGRSWDTGEHAKGHFEVQASIFLVFQCIWGAQFWEFSVYSGSKKVYFVMLFPRLFFLIIVGFEFRCLGLEDQAFDIRRIAKRNFHRRRISFNSRVPLSWF